MGRESIRVTRSVSLHPDEIELRVSRSSGPGGQHANKAETRVEAVFDVEASGSLSDAQKRRVVARAGAVLRAVAQDERSQARNRELAVERLVSKPIEDRIAALDDVMKMETSIRDGVSFTAVEFETFVDADKKFDEVTREVNALRPEMPPETQIIIRRFSPGLVNTIQIALVSDDARHLVGAPVTCDRWASARRRPPRWRPRCSIPLRPDAFRPERAPAECRPPVAWDHVK